MKALFNKWLIGLYLTILIILSGLPGDQLPDIEFDNHDKVIHALMYAGLSGLIGGFGLLNTKYSTPKVLILAVLFASGYGCVMEILQEYVFSKRSFDVYDIMSNIIGSLLGAIIVNFIINSKK